MTLWIEIDSSESYRTSNGIFYKNIAAMYAKTEYSILIGCGSLKPIASNLGLKQGCPLSPLLFNLYIDDVRYIFDDKCHPIEFQEIQISHFLFADDLVLLSLTKEGLQTCLNKLDKYAADNAMIINTDKTKAMIFNQSGRMIWQSFKIGIKQLRQVQTFCYLGFEIKASGTVTLATQTLCDKTNKAMRPLMGVIARFNIPVRTLLQLFHTYISPIALYTTENWMILSKKKLESFLDIFEYVQ